MKDNMAIARLELGRSVRFVLLIATVCLASTLVSRDASAAPKQDERYMVLGTIENVDSTGNTITVRLADGTDKTLRLGKRLTVNGQEENTSRAESALSPKERAVIYYKANGGDETAVDVESLNRVMHKSVTGTLISADKDMRTLVLRTANGKEEKFRVQNNAIIETADNVMSFGQFDPQAGVQITLHYEDPLGMQEVSRIKH